MSPELKTLSPTKLVGMRLSMSLVANRTPDLWRSFMPRRNQILNAVGNDLISMQVYPTSFDFSAFDPHHPFEKWAARPVLHYTQVPEGMETFDLPGGLYAVFHYKGLPTDPRIFQYIFGQWLPSSPYIADHRPHFEILGDKYKNHDPESEEEIWIPIKERI